MTETGRVWEGPHPEGLWHQAKTGPGFPSEHRGPGDKGIDRGYSTLMPGHPGLMPNKRGVPTPSDIWSP